MAFRAAFRDVDGMRELREGRGTSRTRRALRETSPFRPPTRSGNPGPRGDRDYIGRDLRERDREGPRGRGTTAAPNTLGRRNGNGYNGNYSASSSPRMGPGRGGPTRENFALVPAGGAPLELQRVLPPEYDALYEKGGGASALKHREEQFEDSGVQQVDRDRTAPFLLRIFYRNEKHHRIEEFRQKRINIDDELQVYTWIDVSLRELSDLIKDVLPDTRARNIKLHFKLIYPGPDGRNVMTELGEVHSVFKRGEDFRPVLLRQGKIFEIGDMLSVAVMQETGQEWTERWKNPRKLNMDRGRPY